MKPTIKVNLSEQEISLISFKFLSQIIGFVRYSFPKCLAFQKIIKKRK